MTSDNKLGRHLASGGEFIGGPASVPARNLRIILYTEYAGLEISDFLCNASPFSRQIANGNAGPTSTLESMGAKPTFRCHFLNIGPSYKQ